MSVVEIREAEEGDDAQIVALLDAAFGPNADGPRTIEFFRWKHRHGHFGPSLLLVATDSERIVGLRALMPWRLVAGGRTVRALRGVDSATDPGYQGRGVFSELSREVIRRAGEEAELLFNTPNDRSRRAYLRLGWQLAGSLRVLLRVRRPVRFVLGARTVDHPPAAGSIEVDAPAAADALAHPGIPDLLVEATAGDPRLRTAVDVDYLGWRYAQAPGLDYRIVVDERGGELRALAVLRVRPRGRLWEAMLLELLSRSGDRAAARRVISAVARAAPVDFVACSLPERPPRFLPSPRGMALTVRCARPVDPDPTTLASWALSLGDVEQL